MGLNGIGNTEASNGGESKGGASGGYLHLNNPDSSFYTGSIQTVPVAGSDTTVNWGAAPVPCTTTDVAIYMNFNGTSIPIQPTDLWTNIGGVCVGNIKGWADLTRTTTIMGSAFFRNAYVKNTVFTTGRDSTQNTVGTAARANAAQENKNTDIITGSAIGGVGFIALLGFGIFFLARHFKRRTAPSAQFAFSGVDQTTMGSRTMTALSLDPEKAWVPMTGSSFWGSPTGTTAGLLHQPQHSPAPYVVVTSTGSSGGVFVLSTSLAGLVYSAVANGCDSIVRAWKKTHREG
ncbi:hypothetical protein FRC00_002395 [Tulasnella sp. 408]|nr:hypothetical protein FRC00_002395 [Tulasnella sp. 408]